MIDYIIEMESIFSSGRKEHRETTRRGHGRVLRQSFNPFRSDVPSNRSPAYVLPFSSYTIQRLCKNESAAVIFDDIHINVMHRTDA